MKTQSRFFKEEGYAIFPKQIPTYQIDNLLFELKRFKNSKQLFYSQSEHNWRRVDKNLDDHFLLNVSLQNFTDILWANSLAKAGRNILQSKYINQALTTISSDKEFIMWQNMLFDKSTGTVDHIDSWYLDTNPYGNLLAIWVALEDINGDGGSFHVFPKSHLDQSFDWIGIDHDSLIKWSISKQTKYSKKSIFLKKGDLLVWHPFLIHGSSLQKINGASRKSITAHYCPINYLMGGGGLNDSQDTNLYKNLLKKQLKNSRSFGYAIYNRRSRKKIVASSVYGMLRYLLNFGNNTKMLMNRSLYK